MKSYISAIKGVLRDDGYEWNHNKVLFESLIQACHLVNDTVMCRLPIHGKLLEMILFELQRVYASQPYLEILYKSIFMLMYYGLMRIGEVVSSSHRAKAKDVHVAMNKDKILVILYSSKTHSKESLPQKIKISSLISTEYLPQFREPRFFCPFATLRSYMQYRGAVDSETEHFFVFPGKLQILPSHVRSTLRNILRTLNLEPLAYNTHSFRIG